MCFSVCLYNLHMYLFILIFSIPFYLCMDIKQALPGNEVPLLWFLKKNPTF